MKKYLAIAAGAFACAMFMSTTPVVAAEVGVGINIGVPGVYVQERPQYVRPEYESDWRERRERAYRWHEEKIRERHDDRRDYRDDHHDRDDHRHYD
jgi:hypothetical protein